MFSIPSVTVFICDDIENGDDDDDDDGNDDDDDNEDDNNDGDDELHSTRPCSVSPLSL